MKSLYWKQTYDYGVCVPKSVEEAVRIYRGNGNTLWKYSIDKDMTNNSIVFNIREEG